MIPKDIQRAVRDLAEPEMQVFTAKLVPNKEPQTILGVRVPDLRDLAKNLWKNERPTAEAYLRSLPHDYLEEDQLHGLLIAEVKDFDRCFNLVQDFLPYIDNWAVCDILSPRAAFSQNLPALLGAAEDWINDAHPYVCRFGIGVLTMYFLKEHFEERLMQSVAGIAHEDYYVRMMVAWYFAEALVHQEAIALRYLDKSGPLPEWTRRKAISKACDSRRIEPAMKNRLRSLR